MIRLKLNNNEYYKEQNRSQKSSKKSLKLAVTQPLRKIFMAL